MKLKRRWKILIGIGIFFILLAVLAFTMHFRPAHAVEAYKNSLRAKGEKLKISEVLPPHVPAESNGLEVLASAFRLLAYDDYSNLPPMMRMVAPGKALVGWAQPALVEFGSPGYTNSWANAEANNESNRPALNLVYQATLYPSLDFQLDYSRGWTLMLPQLAPLKRCSQKLSAAAMCALHLGDAAAAATNICTQLALIHGYHNENLLISQLVRIAMASIAAADSWELLQATNLTDQELDLLQSNWQRQEFIHGVESALLMERAMGQDRINKMRASSAGFASMMPVPTGSSAPRNWLDEVEAVWDQARYDSLCIMWRSSWSYPDELQALKGQQIILEAVRLVATNQYFNPAYSNMQAQLDSLGITNFPDNQAGELDAEEFRHFISGNVPALSRTVLKAMVMEASKRIVVTAIALKRFQLKNGRLPEALVELTPEFLSSVPLDPVDGRPLRYHPNSDGTYLLYSIGDDGVDGGGDLTPAKSNGPTGWGWQRARDWVWPQPATPEEVKHYYEHPRK